MSKELHYYTSTMKDSEFNIKVVRFEVNLPPLTAESMYPKKKKTAKKSQPLPIIKDRKPIPSPKIALKKDTVVADKTELIEKLLSDLYRDRRFSFRTSRSNSATSVPSSASFGAFHYETVGKHYLETLDLSRLHDCASHLRARFAQTGELLARRLRRRDRLCRMQDHLCRVISAVLESVCGEEDVRFSARAAPGGGGYEQWLHAMRLVARLPQGVPQHFRKKLWLTLAERYLESRGVRGARWAAAERACFNDTANPDDADLAVQIVKDLHRTGCSLFCGTEGRENQAMLRRVLLGYARWNKQVGYCQGFNMLAAIILEVMDRSESDSLKVMIYLVESVLPEGYFADDLRGLSADMAAFRDLMRLRLPRLARHMDRLQQASGDGASYEPPLPDVFTMQWFLTLYATWLPRAALLRVWDLAMLDGSEVLLTTALAIWEMLQDRILLTRSADEFYSVMGALAAGPGGAALDPDVLLARVAEARAAPELPALRKRRRYDVAPFAGTVQTAAKKGLRLLYSEDEAESSDEANKLALATNFPIGMAAVRDRTDAAGDRLSLDIGALKRQYARLRERQRQAHVILAAACARHAAVGVSASPGPLTVNHLLLGKSAIIGARGRIGPPPGAIPPIRQHKKRPGSSRASMIDDTINWNDETHKKSVTRRDSIRWKDIRKVGDSSISKRKESIDIDESGDGIIVTDLEANEMMSSIRTRSKSESSSYSECSGSSTSTSLCDEPNKISDFDSEPGSMGDNSNTKIDNYQDQALVNKGINLSSSNNIENFVQEFAVLLDNNKNNEQQKEESLQQLIDKTLDEINAKKLEIKQRPSDLCESTSDNFLKLFEEEQTKSSEILHQSLLPEKYLTQDYKNKTLPSKSEKVHTAFKSRNENIRSLDFHDAMIPDMKTSSKSEGDILYSSLKFRDQNSLRSEYFGSSANFMCSNPLDLKEFDVHASYAKRDIDIIENLSMTPNFIPDIELSEKIPGIDSPRRSPGNESIVLSEDEPPILLKIDKYFEHSPEFFGARKSCAYESSDDDDDSMKRSCSRKRLSRTHKKPKHQFSENPGQTVEKLGSESYDDDDDDNDEDSEYLKTSPSKYYLSNSPEILKQTNSEEYSLRDAFGNQSKVLLKEKSEPLLSEKDNQISLLKPKPLQSFQKEGDLNLSRRNSEKALQIIQENSKILSRILVKQVSKFEEKSTSDIKLPLSMDSEINKDSNEPDIKNPEMPSYYKKKEHFETDVTLSDLINEFDKNIAIASKNIKLNADLLNRQYSDTLEKTEENLLKNMINKDIQIQQTVLSEQVPTFEVNRSPRGNNDIYGWENKCFSVKLEPQAKVIEPKNKMVRKYSWESITTNSNYLPITTSSMDVTSLIDSYSSATQYATDTLTSMSELQKPYSKTISSASFDINRELEDIRSENPDKYSDSQLSNLNDSVCRVRSSIKTFESAPKLETSQTSDFAFTVTSSMSFPFDPSTDDGTSAVERSNNNSSDTLCQITSLDQVSTPISPKSFPSNINQKDHTHLISSNCSERSAVDGEKKYLSDETSCAVTSLNDSETLSSCSFNKTPTSSSVNAPKSSPDKSFNPFPTRASLREPKEHTIRLGMYSRDPLKSPSK